MIEFIKLYSEFGMTIVVILFAWVLLRSALSDKKELRNLIENHLVSLEEAQESHTLVLKELVLEVRQHSKMKHCEEGEDARVD